MTLELVNNDPFEPLKSALNMFAEKYSLELSRVTDNDPVLPFDCYFLAWRREVCRGCYMRVCSRQLNALSTGFCISTSCKKNISWDYSVEEGVDKFMELLEHIKRFIENEMVKRV